MSNALLLSFVSSHLSHKAWVLIMNPILKHTVDFITLFHPLNTVQKSKGSKVENVAALFLFVCLLLLFNGTEFPRGSNIVGLLGLK